MYLNIEDLLIDNSIFWLDEHLPGWENKVDLHTLNLSSNRYCVLGQLADELVEQKKNWLRLRKPKPRDFHSVVAKYPELRDSGSYGFMSVPTDRWRRAIIAHRHLQMIRAIAKRSSKATVIRRYEEEHTLTPA